MRTASSRWSSAAADLRVCRWASRREGGRVGVGVGLSAATATSPSRSSAPMARMPAASTSTAPSRPAAMKAILLVASLAMIRRPTPPRKPRSTMMITESDNGAAGHVGGQGHARRGQGGRHGGLRTGRLDLTRASPPRMRRASTTSSRSAPADDADLRGNFSPASRRCAALGIPAAAGPEGWTAYFKSGWLGLDNKLMVQAAWLGEGQEEVGARGTDRREPHALQRMGHAEGRRPGCCSGKSRRRRTSRCARVGRAAAPPSARYVARSSGYSIASTVSSMSPAGRRQSTVLPTRRVHQGLGERRHVADLAHLEVGLVLADDGEQRAPHPPPRWRTATAAPKARPCAAAGGGGRHGDGGAEPPGEVAQVAVDVGEFLAPPRHRLRRRRAVRGARRSEPGRTVRSSRWRPVGAT